MSHTRTVSFVKYSISNADNIIDRVTANIDVLSVRNNDTGRKIGYRIVIIRLPTVILMMSGG